MEVFGYKITATAVRIAAMVLGIVILLIVVGFTVKSCDSHHSQAAQTQLDKTQSAAFSNSAGDAVNTATNVSSNQAATEDLTRSNAQDIRNAAGANDAVNPAVKNAGIKALCKRKTYAHDPRCHTQP